MAYTETSTYGFITGDELEAYMICTFASIDARYTEAVVMAKVSQAERIINSLSGQTNTATDGVVALTMELSKFLWSLQLYEDHPESWVKEPSRIVLDAILNKIIDAEEYSPVDSIAMQGIDR